MKKKHEGSKPFLPVQTKKARPQTIPIKRSQRQISVRLQGSKAKGLSETEDECPLIIPRKQKVEKQIPISRRSKRLRKATYNPFLPSNEEEDQSWT